MRKKIIVGIVLFLVVISIAKNKIIEISVENICTHVIGTKLDIASMQVGIVRPVIAIKGMKLYNPKGYPTKIMAEIPEIYVHYNLPEMVKGKVYLEELRFSMKELNIVKNYEGKVNLNSIKPVENEEDGKQIEEQDKGKVPEVYIKTFFLKAGDVYYRDYSKSSEQPTVNKFEINLDEKYENISDPYTLVRLIIYSVLMNTTVSNVVNVPMAGVKDVYKTGTKVVTTAVKKAGEVTETAARDAEDVLKKAAAGFGSFLGSHEKSEEK
ncbi:MAG: hypothetical protein WBD12_03015 [Candidatus Omnitrophota bacterium]